MESIGYLGVPYGGVMGEGIHNPIRYGPCMGNTRIGDFIMAISE
jgi:hypothetical protein